MGVYNCKETIIQALDSLMTQTYHKFKVILCDDGSSDGTYNIVEEYSKRFPGKFILFRNQCNMGLNYTLNRCLELVDTEYVARMDGDDISLPDRFEKEIRFLDTHREYSIVSTPMIYFDEYGDYFEGKGGYEPKKSECVFRPPYCHATCLIRTEAYQIVGGYTVSPDLIRLEDYDLWIKMYAHNFRGYVMDKPLYKWREKRTEKYDKHIKSRIRLAKLQFHAVKILNLPLWKYMYCLRPILVSFIPNFIYNYFHQKRLSSKSQ